MDTNVFKDISYGMYIATTKSEKNVGCFINTLVQITSASPKVSICVNKENYTNKCIKKSKKFAISILEESTSDKIISTFGYFSSKDKDKFQDVLYKEEEGIPVVVEGVCSYIVCDLVDVVDCGTHDLFIGEVKIAKKLSDVVPMTYKYYHEVLKGSSPSKAPTYIEEKKEKKTTGKYRCKICGYIYDDEKEPVPFASLSSDWKCPRCGVGKEFFEEI